MDQRIAELERHYEFRQPEEVRAFLMSHPDVLPVVEEATRMIPRSIPTDDQLALDVTRDPEDEDDNGMLYAVLTTSLAPEDTAPYRAELEQAWLLNAFRRAGGWFNVHITSR